MPAFCCAFNCANRASSTMALFRIPQGDRNRSRREIWLKRISRKHFSATQIKNARLCQEHFSEDQFERQILNKKKLKPNAIPTLFSHRPVKNSRKPCSYVNRDIETESTNNNQCEISSLDSSVILDDSETATNCSVIQDCSGTPSINDVLCIEFDEMNTLKRKLNLAQKNILKLEKENENLKGMFEKMFNDDQVKYLSNGMVHNWSNETIQKSLAIRLACGSKGYEFLKNMGYPLPSERTLQRRIEGLNLTSGVSEEVLKLMEIKIRTMEPIERHAVIMMDEMALSEGINLDISTGYIVGKSTIPTAGGNVGSLANHALVFMICGLSTRWKQVIGYHFSSNSWCPKTLKLLLLDIIKKYESLGLIINVLVSDMGGGNQGVWREFGILAGKYSKTRNYCTHPCDSERKLFFIADPPHIFKNIRNHLVSCKQIILPLDIVEQHGLPSAQVSVDYIKQTITLDCENELRLAPKLNHTLLELNHYDKMKVGPACALIQQATAVAMRYYVKEGRLSKEALTTAWFIDIIAQWFSIMTSRSPNLALSHKKIENYKNAITILEKCILLFHKLQIGNKPCWKPVQTGMILSTTSILDLQDLYLNNYKFNFFLLGRLTQDAIENLFSVVRFKNAVPTAKEFKTALRIIVIEQYFMSGKNSNYASDGDTNLISVLKQTDMNVITDDPVYEVDDLIIEHASQLVVDEMQSLYYLSGCIANKVSSKYALCKNCKLLLRPPSNTTSDCVSLHLFTKMKAFKENSNSLIFVSNKVFQYLLSAENCFRTLESDILKTKYKVDDIVKIIKQNSTDDFPICCNINNKLLKVFVVHRIYFLLKQQNFEIKQKKNQKKCGSKSIAMRIAVKEVK